MDLILFSIVLVLFFSFWNGFTDAANAIATIVGSRVLKPWQAVVLSAAGNFVGIFFGTAVAATIGKGIISLDLISGELVISALIGGLLWDFITYKFAIPCSESHVLVGGLVGAAFAATNSVNPINFGGVWSKVVVPMVFSPLIAFAAAFVFMLLVLRIFRSKPLQKTNNLFKKLQIVSSFFFSVSHGANDAQKSMGILAALLLYYSAIDSFYVPLWVTLSCFIAISLGTLFGGWRIVKTMGVKITNLRPLHGFAAEASGSAVLLGTAALGFPVSTTHVISGSIVGVGATQRVSAVRWGLTRKIVAAWILTIPMSALFSFAAFHVLKFFL